MLGYTVFIHSSILQDHSQQTKLKAITNFSGLYSILKEVTAKLESSTSVEHQKGVFNTALHPSAILLKVSKKNKLIGIILFAVRVMYGNII